MGEREGGGADWREEEEEEEGGGAVGGAVGGWGREQFIDTKPYDAIGYLPWSQTSNKDN